MIRIYDGKDIRDEEIFARSEEQANVAPAVAAIIADVRENKDKALFAYTEKFDHVSLSSLLVSEQEIEEAVESVDPLLLEVMSEAAQNIAAYHEKQIRHDFSMMEKDEARDRLRMALSTVLRREVGDRMLIMEIAGEKKNSSVIDEILEASDED